jgi:hypothetical protein
MILFYTSVAIVMLMIAYAGVEGTLRVFTYWDLKIRFLIIRIRMYFMGRKLRRQLYFMRKELDAKRTPIKK